LGGAKIGPTQGICRQQVGTPQAAEQPSFVPKKRVRGIEAHRAGVGCLKAPRDGSVPGNEGGAGGLSLDYRE